MIPKGRDIAVSLVVDMSYYHESLKPGCRGSISCSKIPRDRSGYMAVSFPSLDSAMDVLWDHLMIEDDEIRGQIQADEKKEEESLIANTKVATIHNGPRGGFKGMVVELVGGRKVRIVSLERCNKITSLLPPEKVKSSNH